MVATHLFSLGRIRGYGFQEMRDELVIFNLELDLDSPVLAVAHDWVESFAGIFEKVTVYSTHIGRISLPLNVSVKELGGGSARARIVAVFRLLKSLAFCLRNRGNIVVFHHMSTYSAVILGPFFRFLRIRQGIWYSHSVRSKSLWLAAKLANVIFSSTPDALPLVSRKSRFVGHGINLKKFKKQDFASNNRSGIVSLGRYAPIKNFEEFLEIADSFKDMVFEIYGPSGNLHYKNLLVEQFESKFANVSLYNSVNYREIPDLLSKYEYFYSGTPKSVDKAAIEAALSGCFIISTNTTTLDVTGMSEVWKFMKIPHPNNLARQIWELETTQEDRGQLRKLLISKAQERNNLETLTAQIKLSLCL